MRSLGDAIEALLNTKSSPRYHYLAAAIRQGMAAQPSSSTKSRDGSRALSASCASLWQSYEFSR